jgi:threonine dehydratase
LQETEPRTGGARPTVSDEAIERAAVQLRVHLQPTPLQHSRAFTAKAGCHVYFKIEGIQPTRAFKVRGALTKLIGMPLEARAAGVVTASAGNHGLGVAYAAQAFRVPATVYVPDNANPFKVPAIRRLGARVVQVTGELMVRALKAR